MAAAACQPSLIHHGCCPSPSCCQVNPELLEEELAEARKQADQVRGGSSAAWHGFGAVMDRASQQQTWEASIVATHLHCQLHSTAEQRLTSPARPHTQTQTGQQYDEEGLRRTVEEQAKTAHVMAWLQQNIKVTVQPWKGEQAAAAAPAS